MIPSKRSCLALGNPFRTLPRPSRRHSPTEWVGELRALLPSAVRPRSTVCSIPSLEHPVHEGGRCRQRAFECAGFFRLRCIPSDGTRWEVASVQSPTNRDSAMSTRTHPPRKSTVRMKKFTHNSRAADTDSRKCDLHKPLQSQGFQRQILRHPPFAKAILTRFRGPSTKFLTAPRKFPRET